MFRHAHWRPRPSFANLIKRTDYPGEPRSFLQVFLAGVAVVLGLKLMSSLRNSVNRSWLERGVLAVLLLMVASYVAKRSRRL